MKKWRVSFVCFVVSLVLLTATGCAKRAISAGDALNQAETIVPDAVVRHSNTNVVFDNVSNPPTWHVLFVGANVSAAEVKSWYSGKITLGEDGPPGFYWTVVVNVDANSGTVEDAFATSAPSSGGPGPAGPAAPN